MKTSAAGYFLTIFLSVVSMTGYSQDSDLQHFFKDTTIRISEVGTNTIRSDFGPSVISGKLYFTSYSDKVLGKTDKKLRRQAFYDLYKAKIDSLGNTVSNREPVKEFVTQFHDGQVAWCEKTRELFVTQSENPGAKPFLQTWNADTVRLRIVIAKENDGKWESITEFPYNNPSYSVGHPAITRSGDTLVFTSNKPGGYGETDLYCAIRKNGEWDTPVNLGPSINTAGKEEFPFITVSDSSKSYLLFSSTGRPGFGGLDLYFAPFPVGSGSRVSHIAFPFNSASDDFAMVVPRNKDFGYLTSNRPGTGNDDIYKFNFIKPVTDSLMRELYVFNQKSQLPVSGAQVLYCNGKYHRTDHEGKTGRLSLIENCEVLASKTGYTDTKKLLTLSGIKPGEVIRDTVWLTPRTNKIITLSNIYYDLDKWDILPEAAHELDQLVSFMNENPSLTVELGSHTDSRASEEYNLLLSQRRAEAAVNYIISKGIAAARISHTGYGESRILNRCTEGVDCTPEEHRQNRRTEIFIPDYGKSGAVPQTEGDYSNKSADPTITKN